MTTVELISLAISITAFVMSIALGSPPQAIHPGYSTIVGELERIRRSLEKLSHTAEEHKRNSATANHRAAQDSLFGRSLTK